ncbi:hypothetical protein H3N35_10860 [Thalassomonas haliotis]|uniref:Uncharacterized protein n=1 Tax=Thalassomonas haliotis TaxID=485448 RepID=A0ABY7VJX5_9GAMM|nr:hypothetical protein H3N35_10860 [Thalassomonas haliotis]
MCFAGQVLIAEIAKKIMPFAEMSTAANAGIFKQIHGLLFLLLSLCLIRLCWLSYHHLGLNLRFSST